MQQFTILRRAAVLVAVVVSVFAVTAGGGSSAKSSASAAAAGSLTIKNFVFSPNPLNAKAGDTITVTNNDGTDHQVVADDNSSFDTGPFSSGTKTFTVSKAGTIPYHCEIHDYMTGVIQVAAG